MRSAEARLRLRGGYDVEVKRITRRRDKEDTMVRDELIERLVELRGWRRGTPTGGVFPE